MCVGLMFLMEQQGDTEKNAGYDIILQLATHRMVTVTCKILQIPKKFLNASHNTLSCLLKQNLCWAL